MTAKLYICSTSILYGPSSDCRSCAMSRPHIWREACDYPGRCPFYSDSEVCGMGQLVFNLVPIGSCVPLEDILLR